MYISFDSFCGIFCIYGKNTGVYIFHAFFHNSKNNPPYCRRSHRVCAGKYCLPIEKCPNRVNASVTANEKNGDVEEPAYF